MFFIVLQISPNEELLGTDFKALINMQDNVKHVLDKEIEVHLLDKKDRGVSFW